MKNNLAWTRKYWLKLTPNNKQLNIEFPISSIKAPKNNEWKLRPLEFETDRIEVITGLPKRTHIASIRACLHGGRGPQIGDVTRLGGVKY